MWSDPTSQLKSKSSAVGLVRVHTIVVDNRSCDRVVRPVGDASANIINTHLYSSFLSAESLTGVSDGSVDRLELPWNEDRYLYRMHDARWRRMIDGAFYQFFHSYNNTPHRPSDLSPFTDVKWSATNDHCELRLNPSSPHLYRLTQNEPGYFTR